MTGLLDFCICDVGNIFSTSPGRGGGSLKAYIVSSAFAFPLQEAKC